MNVVLVVTSIEAALLREVCKSHTEAEQEPGKGLIGHAELAEDLEPLG